MVRSTEYVESPWDEHQRGLMVALAEWEATRCPACGGDPAECQDPAADANNPHGKWVYDSELPIECHRGTAARRALPEKDDRVLLPQVTRRPRGSPSARSSRG